MKRLIIILAILTLHLIVNGQIVSISPSDGTADDEVTLTFDASQGNHELLGENNIYVHLGIVIDKPDGTEWKHVMGNWGQDDGIGKMKPVEGSQNKWQIQFSPSIREYFTAGENENIFRIACVFRNIDGSKKGTIAPGNYEWGTSAANNDIYVNLNSHQNYLTLITPSDNQGFINQGESLNIRVKASREVTSMQLFLDEGQGYEEKAVISSGISLEYDYYPTTSTDLGIKIEALIQGETLKLEKQYFITVIKQPEIASMPYGLKSGVNYNPEDPSKATLVLLAPDKNFSYIVGDFTDWQAKDEYFMKRTPDKQYFWLEIDDLEPGKDYVYQYWIDGQLTIADPFARQVADPWNDSFITPDIFPDLPLYERKDLGIASVLRTGQTSYNWSESESDWQRPDINHAVIYELHIRDFLTSHSYRDLTDTLNYLKRLGVDIIELMPINEFEGNDSWGYNPSFYFAVDKYYGTADDLKHFIESAHQLGMGVVLDIVLNHAFGQCPLVQMYFEGGKPAANNPWFNREYVGQYQWGYDFNHESQYTKNLVDEINRYWLEEFHFDGFRFDFTKGFTNYAPGGSVDNYDASRIKILKRMADKIWETDPEAYIILEHWAPANEEAELGAYGMKMWRNKTYDFVPAITGNPTGTFAGHDTKTHVSFFGSHDEQRIAQECLVKGRSMGDYNIKDTLIMFERMKLAAAFNYLQPGPKMIWQFDELGYDIDIDFNGRTGRKPYVWGSGSLNYYESPLRQNIYTTFKELLKLRKAIKPEVLAKATKNHQLTGKTRRLAYDTEETDLVVIGNFDVNSSSISPKFTESGWWFDYFSGDSLNVKNVDTTFYLEPGQWFVFTNNRLSPGFPGVVETYENPVTITPYPFSADDKITIRFDATKASKRGTLGLVDVSQVYFQSGVITSNKPHELTHMQGDLPDNTKGKMMSVEDNIWEIDIIPSTFYSTSAGESIQEIGMWFRNDDDTRKGYGFRDRIIYFKVQDGDPILSVSPQDFGWDTEVTITFNAAAGNGELVGAEKVYIHSGVVLKETPNPTGSDWQNTVGNWGKDDGIGEMTKVSGKSSTWQITIKPGEYFNLDENDHPYWIAAVFRNADGSLKGTTASGDYDFGRVETASLDYFIKNKRSSHSGGNGSNIQKTPILVPNPTDAGFRIDGIKGTFDFVILSEQGKIIKAGTASGSDYIDTTELITGYYICTVISSERKKTSLPFFIKR